MRIAMIGTGYVGLVSGVCFSDFGHDVVCVDKDSTKIDKLERGEVDLEESIAIYERCAALNAHCEAKLKSAELKVEQIVQGKDGTVETEPARFD